MEGSCRRIPGGGWKCVIPEHASGFFIVVLLREWGWPEPWHLRVHGPTELEAFAKRGGLNRV